jgi:lambda repressor-like predicted transcriptional regulator
MDEATLLRCERIVHTGVGKTRPRLHHVADVLQALHVYWKDGTTVGEAARAAGLPDHAFREALKTWRRKGILTALATAMFPNPHPNPRKAP